jgi:predicted ATPase/nucleoside phosphorylase
MYALTTEISSPAADILLVTATDMETMTVVEMLRERFGRTAVHRIIDGVAYYDLGMIGQTRVFQVQSEIGSGGPSGSTLTIDDGIQALNPALVLLVGIAFGTRRIKQVIGDILVADAVAAYERQRIGMGSSGDITITARGFRMPASPQPLALVRTAAHDWKGPKIHFGTILSGEKLIDHQSFLDQLLTREPETIGGEMEGAGLVATAQRRRVDWLLIKAISDWADGHKIENQQRQQKVAARNAVSFVFFALWRLNFTIIYKNRVQHEKLQASLDLGRTNLPAQTTSFIGRVDDIEIISALLQRDDVRLITLTGPGGVGKTRLAIEVANTVRAAFREGVYLVELATIRDPELVVAAIAQTVGARELGGQSLIARLIDFLHDQQTLLVIDNFEQVVDAAPDIAELLSACPALKILATSRAVLRLTGEQEYEVAPLACPTIEALRDAGLDPIKIVTTAPATRLFLERTRAVRLGFALDAETAQIVAEICRRLDGLPLALELAAARGKLLTPAALLPRLNRRLDLLAHGQRDRSARHQTLRGAIGWSYDLLTDPEQVLFRCLGIFVGGCSLEVAEDLLNTITIDQPKLSYPPALELLSGLLNASIIRRIEVADRRVRIGMFETIREYAIECLDQAGELKTLRTWHAQHFLAMALRAEPMLRGAKQINWLDRLEQERGNFGYALDWFLEGGLIDDGLALVNVLHDLWAIRGYFSEGRAWTERLLEGSKGNTTAYTQALWSAGDLAERQGDSNGASRYYHESLARCRANDDVHGTARALASLSEMTRSQGDHVAALPLAEESERLYRSLGDAHGLASALNVLGAIARNNGDFTHARDLVTESLDLFRKIGDQFGEAWLLYRLGIIASYQGDTALERTCYEESLRLRRVIGDKWGAAYSLNNLGLTAVSQGEYAQARTYYLESRAILTELGDQLGIVSLLTNLGTLARMQGELDAASTCYEEGLARGRKIGDKPRVAEILCNMGFVARARGRLDLAAPLFAESLTLYHEMNSMLGILTSLLGFAAIEIDCGDIEQGTQLLGMIEAALKASGWPLEKADRDVAALLAFTAHSSLGERFDQVWSEGQRLRLEEVVRRMIGHALMSRDRE